MSGSPPRGWAAARRRRGRPGTPSGPGRPAAPPELRRGLVYVAHRALGGALARGVTVEHARDAMLALALHQLDVVQPERRAQRGHRVGEARLVHGNDVGVALADCCVARGRHGLLGAVVGKEVLALVEDGRVARVDVLGHVLLLAHDAPAEGDGAPQLVVDGKHHALVEAVGGAAAAVLGKVGRHQLSRREAENRAGAPPGRRGRGRTPGPSDGTPPTQSRARQSRLAPGRRPPNGCA